MAANDNTKRLQSVTAKPGLFSPTTVKNLNEGGGAGASFLNRENSATEANLSLGSTASFKYDVPGSGLKSTQQLNLDWSDFANHTFFNSAQVKTNIAFDKIVNEFPFDGTQKEQEVFFDKLTGFEKWVYDQFPKNKGYLYFSGSLSSSIDPNGGTWVTVKDIAGAQYPSLSRLLTGETILDPGLNSMAIETWVYPFAPINSTEKSAILSKVSASTGYSMIMEKTTTAVTVSMLVVSGGIEDKVSLNVPQDEWTHVHFSWDRTPGVNKIYGYRNNILIASSSMPIEFNVLNIGGTDLYVGSGSALGTFNPTHTLSASLDELRIWNTTRSSNARLEYMRKPVYADSSLKLYFKFNEPSGSNSNLVLDHSSNSIHGRLNTRGITLGVREAATGSISGITPMTNEILAESPVLFPEHEDSVDLRAELLLSASNFDNENPNMISRLIPPHYFIEGMAQDGLATEEGDILTDLSGSEPREAKLGSTQAFLSLLYVWAKFFDEMKLYIQAFSTLRTVDYDNDDTIPSDFLSVFARNEGIELPPLFTGTSISQYVQGDNLQTSKSRSILSLQSIQNQIWRRILINLQDVLKSKGTVHAIKAFIRSVGVNPDNNFRIREYGGPTSRPLTFNREKRFEVGTMLNFISGGYIVSTELSSAKGVPKEPGYPDPGPSITGDGTADHLWTSGSFTFEANYKWENIPFASASFDGNGNRFAGITQSLARIEHNPINSFFGSQAGGLRRVGINLLAVTSSANTLPTMELVVKSHGDGLASLLLGKDRPALRLPLTGANIFNGKKWYVSFGRRRGDDGFVNPSISSSWFLRVARQENGEILEQYVTSAYYPDLIYNTGTDTVDNFNLLQRITSPNTENRIVIGSSSLPTETPSTSSIGLLTSSFDISQGFSGKIGQIRFYSKFLKDEEWKEHVVNFKSVGTEDPRKNFNFLHSTISGSFSRFKNVSGSYERLRLDASTDQITTSSSDVVSGNIILTDFTQQTHIRNAGVPIDLDLGEKSGAFQGAFYGSGFPRDSQVIYPEPFWFSFISSRIDEGTTENKVRVRGYQSAEDAFNTPGSDLSPVYKINPNEQPKDSAKLSIDFSIVDTLNQDIITIFGSLVELNNILGNPELTFAGSYKELDIIREMYFEKLEKKIKLKGFFEFYKWFDTNIGSFVEQLVPRKTKFLGTNYIIESHLLERSKVQYQFEDIYLGEDIRSGLKDTILLQLISGEFNRF